MGNKNDMHNGKKALLEESNALKNFQSTIALALLKSDTR